MHPAFRAAAVAALTLPAVAAAHGISEADRQAMLAGGYLQYAVLGAKHMLTGYDHLLFLFGVVFFLTTFRDVAKFVTAFTLGHCITLIAATFLGITWNYWLVDAVIALTVIYKGFDNNGGFQRHFGMRSPDLLAAARIVGVGPALAPGRTDLALPASWKRESVEKRKRPAGRCPVGARGRDQAATLSATSLKSAILSKFMYW